MSDITLLCAPAVEAKLAAWDSLSPDQKRLYARMMEVYAGTLSHADNQIGRRASRSTAQ